MRLTVLGSSSKGNGYVLDNGKEALVIEAGVPYQDVVKAIGYKPDIISACLVSHSHGDHAKHVRQYADNFIDVYGSREMADTDNRIIPCDNLTEKNNRAGRFYFRPFQVEHDVECYGYYIYHPEIGFLLFVTDTAYIRQVFSKIDHVMIECNYSRDILEENFRNGTVTKVQRERVVLSHMSLDTCIETLNANCMNDVKDVILLHMSDGNSNEVEFTRRVTESVGKRVYAANKGMTIELNKEPF